jgi:hypothetical protein
MMKSDDNFVLLDETLTTKWSTATGSRIGSFPLLENNGNLVVFDQDRNSLWATNTTAPCLGTTRQILNSFHDCSHS